MPREEIFHASLEFFLAPIKPYLRDETVTEVMVNGPGEVYIERAGKLERTDARFADEDALRSAVHNVAQYVGREIDHIRPVMDARLPDGSRVHAIIPPGSRRGTCLTIRKFSRDKLDLPQLVRLGSLSDPAREFLELCVRLHKNTVVAGGTGTGKTSLLNALSTAIPPEERIVVIEDSSELRLVQPHCVYLESQQPDPQGRGGLTIRQLFVASLRMRPDRIVVGEVRSGEALDMIQSMLSGHAGSLTTVHASSPRDAMIRLETLSLMSDVQLPVYVARAQVASAIHLIVQLSRFAEDGSRRVTRITEARGLEGDQYQFTDLFISRMRGRDPSGKIVAELEPTGHRPTFAREVVEQGMVDRVRFSASLWDLA
jgi:pilus assembly protein CpaF